MLGGLPLRRRRSSWRSVSRSGSPRAAIAASPPSSRAGSVSCSCRSRSWSPGASSRGAASSRLRAVASTASSASPGRSQKVLVGDRRASTRAATRPLAWVHIAGLTVFAVFAAWWMHRRAAVRARAANPTPGRGAQRSRPPLPCTRSSVAEQFFGTDDPDTVRHQVDTFLVRHLRVGIREHRVHQGRHRHRARRARRRRPASRGEDPPARHQHAIPARRSRTCRSTSRCRATPRRSRCSTRSRSASGVATVESRLPEPPPADPADPADPPRPRRGPRRVRPLRRAARPPRRARRTRARCGRPPPARCSRRRPGSPFDFAATAAGAEWIEEIGARARTLLDAAPRTAPVVGHFDWRSENVPVAGGRVVAVFDWDSVGAATEPIVVGSATHHFTLDWRVADPARAHPRRGPRLRRRLRGGPRAGRSRTAERVAARTAYVFCTAYGARCEHVLASTGQPAPTGFRDRLASAGAALLG